MKDIIILSIILAITGASFNSCEKSEDFCNNAKDLNLGLIVSNYEIGSCYSDLGLLNKEYVIRDEATFEEMGFLKNTSENCTDAELEPIDFEQNTLLGFYAEGTCNVYYTREVTKNSSEKTYTYNLSTQSCGFCERLGFSMNWILIPKIEEDFTVNFVSN